VVGDGTSFNFYEVKANMVKEYNYEKVFTSDFKEQLKHQKRPENCAKTFEELEQPIFTYDFSINNKIEIESSWYLTKEDYGDCLIGNSVVYSFNPKAKQFELENIYWKLKKE
jgi:hypothetical protein